MTLPAPGWYVDPEGIAERRYWDGGRWTSVTDEQVVDSPAGTREGWAHPGDGTPRSQTGMDVENLHWFVKQEIPGDSLPVTSRLQTGIAEILEDDDATPSRLICELISSTLSLEVSLQSAKSAILQLDNLCTSMASYIVGMEMRLTENGLTTPDMEELSELNTAVQRTIEF